MHTLRILCWLPLAALTACGYPAATVGGTTEPAPAPPPGESRGAEAAAPRVVVLGDSLTAGLGLPAGLAFPAKLEARLHEAGYPHEVVAAGVSGDTSAGGLRRLGWTLDGDVRVLVLALGANDGLRGLSVEEMKANLAEIIETAQAAGVAVLLTGMEAPPNFGSTYTQAFREAFRELAREHDTAFVPFLLAGVAGVPELNQADGIHPNAEGAGLVADLLFPALEPLLADGATP